MNIVAFLIEWLKDANVDYYQQEDKEVYIASKCNEQLILTCVRVHYEYLGKKFPHINIIWVKSGNAEVIHQDIVDETYNQITHSTGCISGNEALESIWLGLNYKNKQNCGEDIRDKWALLVSTLDYFTPI